ncbi:hypothetical protein KFE25_001355 [Diacronema lutheri]|uniref:Uncharacterized protein n=2 Tax=Diacronema lutheri TaxID=2081491 RepID=A0A8J6C4I1_DIALT|nr:hypothetical protein KFE25_001355 [Diacronema lutheri]
MRGIIIRLLTLVAALITTATALPSIEPFRRPLERMFNSTIGSLRVEAASAGAWPPADVRVPCNSPRLYVFLSGHYRSFWLTQGIFAEMASRASDGCFLVCAFLPVEVDASTRAMRNGVKGGKASAWVKISRAHGFTSGARDEHVTATDMLRASPLGGRLVFATVRRLGLLDTYGSGLKLSWYGTWALAQWAADVHGFTPAPGSIVLRTRSDVPLQTPLSLRSFDWAYAYLGVRGRHFAIGGFGDVHDRRGAFQGDLLMLTSMHMYTHDFAVPCQIRHGAYASHVESRALRRAFGSLALRNGWLRGGCVPTHEWWVREGCLCPSNDLDCKQPSCPITVAVADWVPRNKDLLRIGAMEATTLAYWQNVSRHLQTGRPIEVAAELFPYCPLPANQTAVLPPYDASRWALGGVSGRARTPHLRATVPIRTRQMGVDVLARWDVCPPHYEVAPRAFRPVSVQ